MTVGVSVSAANTMLNTVGDPYMQLHIGDPGADGTANIAIMTARQLVDLGPAVDGARSLVGGVDWTAPWSGTPQTVTHLSAWSAASAGTFLFSVGLASPIVFSDGMTARITVLSLITPSLAAD